jgi:DnaK suppressor protein
MSEITEENRDRLKDRLIETRKDLLDGVEIVSKRSNEEFETEVPDVNDEASRTYSRQVLLSLGEAERKQLQLVDEALVAMDSGNYGTCIDCEEGIPFKRLEAVPYVKRCVDCKTKYEEEMQAEQ